MRKYKNKNGSARLLARVVSLFVLCGTLLPGLPVSADPRATPFYVSTAGKTKNSGLTPDSPKRHIEDALALARKNKGGTVKITIGRFVISATTLSANITLEGGWNSGVDKKIAPFTRQVAFRTRQLNALKPDTDLCEAHTCITTGTADRVLTLSKPGARLSQLVVIGPDRKKIPGSSSYGVIVDGVDATFQGVVIKAGAGGIGNDGSSGKTGNGFCSNGGAGAMFKSTNDKDDPLSPFCDVKNHHGKQGDTVEANGREANGGGGGKPAKSWCNAWPGFNEVSSGGQGDTGGPGIEGPPGAASKPEKGHLVSRAGALHWVSSHSGETRGQSGSAGGGGGGGGLGSSWNVDYWCQAGFVVEGGTGHTGHRGGCGGTGGEGGHSGGGAFALLAKGGKINVNDVVLFGGQGGVGGTGGDGRPGSDGESNDDFGSPGTTTKGCFGAGPEEKGGTGGKGGFGGKGGGGGAGAGGNGGASYTLVKIGKGKLIHKGGAILIGGGSAGKPGRGGEGADSRKIAPSGNQGSQAPQIQLELKTK